MARFAGPQGEVELWREGTTIAERTVHYDTRKDLHVERAAILAYHARTNELLEDGYARQTRYVDDNPPPDEPELVRAIIGDLGAGDASALEVYTDWLIERGDPRGELAALRAAATPDVRAIASLEKTRALELYGALCMTRRTWRDQTHFLWKRGWITELAFRRNFAGIPEGELMQHVLHAPMARFARWLSVDERYARTIPECVAPCPCLARITGLRIAEGPCWSNILAALPNLEELELLDDGHVDGNHERVNRVLLTIDEGPGELAGEWPRLTRLDLVVKSSLGLRRGAFGLLRRPTLREVRIRTLPLPGVFTDRFEEIRAAGSFDVFEVTTVLPE